MSTTRRSRNRLAPNRDVFEVQYAVEMIFEIPHAIREVQRLHHESRLTVDELESLQWTRFRRILRHAFENTQFFRDKLLAAGIRPEDIRSREDLGLIPITTREELRDSRGLLVDSAIPANLKTSSSSGSTGQKTVSYFDSRAWLKGKYLLKMRARYLCGVRPWDRIAMFQTGQPRTSLARRVFLRQFCYPISKPCDEVIQAVESYSPTVLYGFPSYLTELAGECRDRLQPRLVFTSGEMLGQDQRSKLERVFEGKVLDIYGCTEVKEISWQCSAQEGYHINSDWLLVEVVSRSGEATAGEGNVLVTSLYNFTMPLIRYEVGDTGLLHDHACGCGLSLPIMSPCLGRKEDFLIASGGEAISPVRLMDSLSRIRCVNLYQVVQVEDGSIVVNVVPKRGHRNQSRLEIEAALLPIIGATSVRVDFSEQIAREPSGKFRRVISRVS